MASACQNSTVIPDDFRQNSDRNATRNTSGIPEYSGWHSGLEYHQICCQHSTGISTWNNAGIVAGILPEMRATHGIWVEFGQMSCQCLVRIFDFSPGILNYRSTYLQEPTRLFEVSLKRLLENLATGLNFVLLVCKNCAFGKF